MIVENKLIEKETKKEAIDTIALKALKVMQNVFTDFNLNNLIIYINFSVYGISTGLVPEALLVMQQVDTLRLHRLAGSTPALGGSVLENSDKVINKRDNNALIESIANH